MRLHHIALAGLIGSALVLGCAHKKSATADQSAIQQIRQNYAQVDPNAKVGLVIAVLPDKALAAIGDIPVADVQVGDTLVLLDAKQQIIGAGKVVAKTQDAIHVSYDVTAKGRAPEVGDLAVKAK